MIQVELNNSKYMVKFDISVIETCLLLGVYVPRFCYHETLSIAGNCRMCLVEIFNSPKPVASCALPIFNGIKIFTNSPLVKKARENVTESLLINHPLDCPICDQAGECDLQDQVKMFGSDRTRFFFNKRVVEDKECNSLVKTIMTRCIQCTRCVRFNSEISGSEFLGTLNRGSYTEIGGYSFNIYDSEVSGNIIDLCPVGALTSQQYAFKTRPWKLTIFESIDLTDGLASNIYISIKESDIYRISPKRNRDLNDDIISDKGRFSFDYNKNNRLDKFIGVTSKLDNFKSFNLKANSVSFLFDNVLDIDSLSYLKQLQNIKGNLRILNGKNFKTNFYINWLNNQLISLNNSEITNCFILSSNLRLENSIINVKLKIKQSKNDIKIFGFSCFFKETFSIEFVNFDLYQLSFILESKDSFLSKLFIKNTSPLFIFGENILKRGFNVSFLFYFIKKIIQNVILIKISAINIEAIHFLNFSKLNKKNFQEIESLFLFNLDDNFFLQKILKNKKIKSFFVNTHMNSLLKKDTIFIPLTTEYEQEIIFCNLEGRYQKTSQLFNPINKDILNLTNILNIYCYSNFNNFNNKAYKKYLHFIKYILTNTYIFKFLNKNNKYNFILLKKFIFSLKMTISTLPLKTEIEDFYLSNKFLKESKVMQISSQNKRKNTLNF